MHCRFQYLLALGLATALAGAPGPARAGAPEVVVTIKPVHAIVAGVMAGRGAPALLLEGAASPHAYAMRPSDARRIARAEVIFWIGPAFETFLERPHKALAPAARIVALAEAPGVLMLAARAGGTWDHERAHEAHAAGRALDPHLWLDPENAKAIARAAAEALSAADPEGAPHYDANARDLALRLDALEAEVRATLAPVRRAPYVVFHDAYQYFERRFGLNAVAAITVNPASRPGARRIAAVRQRIARAGAACVFTEPQFPPRLARTVTEGTGAQVASLDPLGVDIPAGADAYFDLIRRMAASLRACLGA